jgi:hypothetical protein
MSRDAGLFVLVAVFMLVSFPAVAVVTKDPGNTTNIDLVIAVDLDRDGEITFTKNLKEVKEESTEATKTDRTSSVWPYRFWINNDYDYVNHNGHIMGNRTNCDGLNPLPSNVGDKQYQQVCEQWEEDPALHTDLKPNSKYPGNRIESFRDLEDFAPLAINLGVKSIGKEYLMKLSGHGVYINLFQGAWSEGEKAHAYIYDEEKTRSQIEKANGYGGFVGVLNDKKNIVLDKNDVERYFDEKGVGRFIFEGVEPTTAGCAECYIEVGYYKKGKTTAEDVLITSDKLYLDLHDIKDFYEHVSAGNAQDFFGDFDAKYFGTTEEVHPLSEDIYRGLYKEEVIKEDYILLVHGWRMRYSEEVAFAETTYKRLYWSGYRGRFGTFTWPTGWYNKPAHIYKPLALIGYLINNVNHYDTSEAVARRVGASQLKPYLETLKSTYGAGSVHVIAHSMGNIVVSEALRQYVLEGESGALVGSYSPSEAATVAGAYYQGSHLKVKHKLMPIPLLLKCDIAPETELNAEAAWYCYNGGYVSDYAMPPDIYRSGDVVRKVGSNYFVQHEETMGPYLVPPAGQPYYHGIDIAAGNMVNFSNPGDAALSAWELNQLNKPWKHGFGHYEYKNDGIDALVAEEEYNNCIDQALPYCAPFTPFSGGEVTSRFIFNPLIGSTRTLSWSEPLNEDAADILAHIVPARTKALGQVDIRKPEGSAEIYPVPLIDNQNLNFTTSNQDHSSQFHGYYSEVNKLNTKRVRASYWNRIIRDSLLLVTPGEDLTGLRNGIVDD